MLADEPIATGANQVPEHEGDDDRVVELACDGNEVGHEVEGKDEVPQQADEQSLPPPRNPGITEQPVDEDDAVRDEARQRSPTKARARGLAEAISCNPCGVHACG
jgi:hypothetical protein